ncbi:MAG: hypothetical protein Q4E12_00320 [Coriobacteriia bacterium]|nr:hypothetical protein [Coriobacteriia bacterium]
MATEEEIRAEVEQMGRLTEEQEQILYNICLRQDELGRQQTNVLLDKVEGSPVYQPMIDRELLTYETYNHGAKSQKHPIASLYVTLKGIRYCIMYGDEISEQRLCDAAGNLRK